MLIPFFGMIFSWWFKVHWIEKKSSVALKDGRKSNYHPATEA